MSSSTRHELRLATAAAWQAARSRPAGAAEPRPGDVFVSAETSHLAVEWVVIENDPAARRLYAVPADTWAQVGSHDVHIAAASACGPLSLRCGLGLWLPPETFGAEARSGVLEDADLDRIRHTWKSIERGAVEAAESQRETDTELEYREWIKSGPEQGRALLEAATATTEPRPSRPAPKLRRSPPQPGPWRGTPPWRGVALAASLLLALTLAGSGMIQRLRTADPEIDPATQTVTLVRIRGVRKIAVPAGVRTLELRIGDSYPKPYRLEVLSADPPQEIRTSEDLNVLLPTRDLPAGEYRILVLALGDAGTRRLGDYRIEIEYQKP